jgi:hypothetical protein
MLELKIDLKKVFFVFLGFSILYLISRAYKMQNDKTESVKKLIPDKDIPFKLSANLQEQIDDVAFKQWQQINFPNAVTATSNVPFEKTFAAVLLVTIPKTEHLKTHVTNVLVLDAVGNSISHGFNINAATQDVTVTFTESETGTVLVS